MINRHIKKQVSLREAKRRSNLPENVMAHGDCFGTILPGAELGAAGARRAKAMDGLSHKTPRNNTIF